MKRSTLLRVLAGVLGAVAGVNGFMAWLSYSWHLEHGASVADATAGVRMWTTIAFIAVAGAVLSAVASAFYSSSGIAAGSGAPGDR